jgi:prevent-host-death family protein
MVINASDFKARCLALIDRVHDNGEPIVITKRGKVVARLVPAGDERAKPWTALRGTARLVGDPFAPVVDEGDLESLK